jgi:hypothetical protein
MDIQSSMMDIFTHAAIGSLPPMFRAYATKCTAPRDRAAPSGASAVRNVPRGAPGAHVFSGQRPR